MDIALLYAAIMFVGVGVSFFNMEPVERARLNKFALVINTSTSVALILIPLSFLTGINSFSISGGYILYLMLILLISAMIFYALFAQIDFKRNENRMGENGDG